MATTYHDSAIDLKDSTLTIKHYYFPAATAKHVKIENIEKVTLINLGVLDKVQIWGSGEQGYGLDHWSNADIKRPTKHFALIIFIKGSKIQPVITPDDPDALFDALQATGVTVEKNSDDRKILTRARHHGESTAEEQANLEPHHQELVKQGKNVPVDDEEKTETA